MTKNEKNLFITIIIESIIICIFIGIFIFGLSNQSRTDNQYKQILTTNRNLNKELSELNLQLESKNTEIEWIESEFIKYYKTTKKAIIQLSENFNQASKIIDKLKSDTISLQENTESVSEATEGIRDILQEITTKEKDK